MGHTFLNNFNKSPIPSVQLSQQIILKLLLKQKKI